MANITSARQIAISYLPANTAGLTLIGALVMMIPALLNGRPFHFVDFNQYYSIGELMLERLLGAAPESAESPAPLTATEPGEAPSAEEEAGSSEGHIAAIAASRSPLYAVIAYLFSARLSMWLISLLQTALASVLVIRFLDFTTGRRDPAFALVVIAGLTLFSTLGFHANLTMPDVFAGFLGIAALLLMFRKDMSWPETASLTALVCASAFLHKTTLLLALFLAGLALLALVFSWSRPHLRRLAPVCLFGAIVLAAGVQAVYGLATEKLTGAPLSSPPYLTARVYDDGPGRRYLEEVCARAPETYALCEFSHFTYDNHNDLIWGSSGDLEKPSFIGSPIEVKRALQAEQTRFIAGAISAYPLSQMTASTGNMLAQFFSISLDEIDEGAVHILHNYTYEDPQALAHTPGFSHCLAAPDSCTEENIFNTLWNGLVTLAGLAGLAGFLALLGVWTALRLSPSGAQLAGQDMYLLIVWTLFLLLLGNAFLCGAASGVHDRYQARLAWLVPLCLIALHNPVRLVVQQARHWLKARQPA